MRWRLPIAVIALGAIASAAKDARADWKIHRATTGQAPAGRSVERGRGRARAAESIEAAIASGDVEAEIEARRAWAVAHPGPVATINLAAALARGQRFREAATLLAELPAGRRGAEAVARVAFDEGRYWAAADELEHAVVALTRARKAAPIAAADLRREILAASIDVARRRGTMDALAQELGRPRDAVEWVARATVAGEQGDSRGVWTSLDQAIRLSPNDLELHRRRIEAARRVGGAAETARLYELLAQIATRTGDAVALGEALDGLWRLGRQDLAARIFDRVVAAPAGKAQLVRVAAELAGKWGDDRRAEHGWQMLLRRDPRDEAAIVALGEARLQRGDRRGALEIWRTLLRSSGVPAEAHARFAETLADHEFAEPAVEEATAAIALTPRQTRYRRVLAGILERQGKLREAEDAWESVLVLARGAAGTAERREARTHLVSLWVREGAVRVANKLVELEEYLRDHPDAEEVRLCLIELDLRTERIDAATTLLKQTWEIPGEPARAESSVELVFALIRSLRQRHRTAEAMTWLEGVASRFPARAREARLQLADMAVAAHDDARAATFASAAVEADPDDAVVALRAAAVEERLGDLAAATRTYRRALGTGADAAGLVALAALLGRSGGEVTEQRALLRQALERGTDDDLLTEAGRRAIALEEAMGSLEELARQLADTADLNAAHPGGPARRRVLALILTRLVPVAYRTRDDDPAAAAKLRRFGRDGIRPLLDLVTVAEGDADIAAIETLGMLGRPEAANELTRLLIADDAAAEPSLRPGGTTVPAGSIQLRTTNTDVARAIVVALGRLGGDVARTTLESVARISPPGLITPLLWSLGRVGSPAGAELASREIGHSSTEASLIACLTLGRVGGREAASTLTEVAVDAGRAPPLRAAAILGLVLGRQRLGAAGDGPLARIAAGEAGVASDAARAALGASPPAMPDEAPLIVGSQIDPDALIRGMTESLARRRAPGVPQPP